MELFEAIKTRRSIRAYKDDAVSKEDLLKVVDAARLAPSWKNTQSWQYIAVSDKKVKHQLGEIVNFNPDKSAYEKAAYVLVLCADPSKCESYNQMDYYLVDAGISFEHAHLAAHALGLGTCWVGVFPEDKVKKLLHIPQHIRVIALSPLGVPDQQRNARPRRSMEDILFEDKWE